MADSAETMIDRVARILAVFGSAEGPLSASEISRRSGIPMPSTHRIVAGLVRTGLLERDDDKRVRLGIRLWEIAARAPQVRSLREVALPYMEELFAAVGMPVLLSVRDGIDVINVETLEPRNLASLNVTEPGMRLPLLASSPGAILTAFADAAERDILLASAPAVRFTPHTPVDPSAIRAAIEAARRTGHIVTRRWMSIDSTGVAVPILDGRAGAIAALSVTLPYEGRAPAEVLPALTTAARLIARAISTGPDETTQRAALLKWQVKRVVGKSAPPTDR